MNWKSLLSCHLNLIVLFLLSLLAAGLYAGAWMGIGLLLFVVAQVTSVLIPGFLLVRWSGFRLKNALSVLFVSYGVGFAAMAVIYALLLVADLHSFSGWVLWGVSALSLLTLLDREVRNDLHSVCFCSSPDVVPLMLLFLGGAF